VRGGLKGKKRAAFSNKERLKSNWPRTFKKKMIRDAGQGLKPRRERQTQMDRSVLKQGERSASVFLTSRERDLIS